MTDGWIVVSRNLLHGRHKLHPHSTGEPACRAFAWIDLIGLAAWQTGGGLERGQARAGQHYLAARWNWSRGKVRRFLQNLANEGAIKRHNERTTRSAREPDIISICNYERFQSARPTNGPPLRTASGPASGPASGTQEEQEQEQLLNVAKATADADVENSVENSQNGTPQDETWNARLAPFCRRAGGEKHVGNWLAWCKRMIALGVSVDVLEARVGGLCEMRDRGIFEHIAKGEVMTPAVFERDPTLRQQADSAWSKYGPRDKATQSRVRGLVRL